MTESISVEETLTYPVERVWAALTDAEALSEWLMDTNFTPEVGSDFTLDTGHFGLSHCTVLEIEKHRRISYSWHNGPLNTVVNWEVTGQGDSTRVVLTHSGFDVDEPTQATAYKGMSGGWKVLVGQRLPNYLSEHTS